MISGVNKRILKKHFEAAGVPWIYEQPRDEVHRESAYNKKPKASLEERNFENKLATIRKNLAMQEERLEKLR